MGTLVDQSIRTKNTWVHVLTRKNIDYEHMGIRVDQNIQTRNTRVHVLMRTFRLRTHGYTCSSGHLGYEHKGTRVDQNI